MTEHAFYQAAGRTWRVDRLWSAGQVIGWLVEALEDGWFIYLLPDGSYADNYGEAQSHPHPTREAAEVALAAHALTAGEE